MRFLQQYNNNRWIINSFVEYNNRLHANGEPNSLYRDTTLTILTRLSTPIHHVTSVGFLIR